MPNLSLKEPRLIAKKNRNIRGYETMTKDKLLKLGTHWGFKWVLQILFDLKPQWIHSKFLPEI